MKKNRLILCIIFILMLFCLTGCYDAKSIESSYYIVAIGIDSGKDNLYNISIQIAKNENGSSETNSSQSSSYDIYQIECETFESRNKYLK